MGGGGCGTYGEKTYIHTYRVLVGGPEEKRVLGRPRHIWKGNVKMDLKERGWEGVISIQLVQDIKNNQLL